MNIQEISLADQRQMFQNSLVLYNTNPVWIGHIGYECVADCTMIGNNEECALDLRDEKFDFTPVNTGYVNLQGYSFFLSRSTRRQWKQGLSPDNISVKYNTLYTDNGRFENAYHRVKELRCKPIFNTVKNIYPSLEQAIESFEDNVREVAFDRQFSVNHQGFLYYKGYLVGNVNLYSHKITFNNEYKYLERAL